MSEFIDWLMSEPKGLQDWINVLKDAMVFWGLTVGLGFVLLGKNPAAQMYDRAKTTVENTTFGSAWKFQLFVQGEDVFYRFWGTYIALWLFPESMFGLLICVVIVSLAFGLLPPHNVYSWRVQAIVACGGFFLSLLYLKCGGLSGNYHQAMFVATIGHLVPSSVFSVAYLRERKKRQKTMKNAPRPP